MLYQRFSQAVVSLGSVVTVSGGYAKSIARGDEILIGFMVPVNSETTLGRNKTIIA